VARRAAASFRIRPLELIYLPSAEPARLGVDPDDEDYDDMD